MGFKLKTDIQPPIMSQTQYITTTSGQPSNTDISVSYLKSQKCCLECTVINSILVI